MLLVINDDPVQLHMLASVLEQEHESVSRFSCSQSAWQWLQEGHVPDGIILDLHMPGINGWQFCELLHTHGAAKQSVPPVLIVSATYTGKDAEALLVDIGASAFLPLPASPTKIRERVRQLIEEPPAPKGFHAWFVASHHSDLKPIQAAFSERGWQVHEFQNAEMMQSAVGLSTPDIIIVEQEPADLLLGDFLTWCHREYQDAMCVVLGLYGDGPESARSMKQTDVWFPRDCDPQHLLTFCEKWRWERALFRVEHLLEVRTSDLHESEAQFRGLFETLPDILVIYDQKGIIRHINTNGAQLLGFMSHDLIESSLARIQSSKKSVPFALDKVEKDDGIPAWSEGILQRKDGTDFPVEMMERPVRFHHQPQTLLVARDMSVRQQMAQENATLEQQLRQVQKMEAVGRLASGVAHDMNNILTAILAHAGLLKVRNDATHPSWVAGDVIEKAVRRGKELTTQLLGFARQGKHHHVPVDIHNVIHEITGLLGRTVDKAIMLRTDLLAHESWVVGDPNQLYQILMNLAVNASDAMSHQGELVFGTSNEQVSEEQAATIPGLTAGAYVVVRVTDTGEGMPQEVQSHIFEPFFTTKEQGQGSGMGLAMVYGIVKNHHGYIGVTSTQGVGTTMRVYLPSIPWEMPTSSVTTASVPSSGTGHVLIIDDELAVAEAAQAILEYLGYATTIRLSGQKALEWIQDSEHSVDLVLLDMVMPDMSGPECFTAIRQVRPDSKILLCTGYDRNHAVQELVNQGVEGFIQKPYDIDELARVCSEILKQPVLTEVCVSGSRV